ncbi:MAG: hypothetical protein ACYDER_08065 [Ktedonobacteraceae bacterium]
MVIVFSVLAALCTLFAIVGLGVWLVIVVQGLLHVWRKNLTVRETASLGGYGIAVSATLLAVPYFYSFLYIDQNMHDPHITLWFFTGLLILGIIWVLLWLGTLVLKLSPKLPGYRFLLPRDANRVLYEECKTGIIIAANFYPVRESQDQIEVLVRATTVMWRSRHFPKGKKQEEQLTNDFAVYTTLAIEGFSCGYYQFLDECQQTPDRLEELRQQLKRWSELPEVEKGLKLLAVQYLDASGYFRQQDESAS